MSQGRHRKAGVKGCLSVVRNVAGYGEERASTMGPGFQALCLTPATVFGHDGDHREGPEQPAHCVPTILLRVPIRCKLGHNHEESGEEKEHGNCGEHRQGAGESMADLTFERDECKDCGTQVGNPGKRHRIRGVQQRDQQENASDEPVEI